METTTDSKKACKQTKNSSRESKYEIFTTGFENNGSVLVGTDDKHIDCHENIGKLQKQEYERKEISEVYQQIEVVHNDNNDFSNTDNDDHDNGNNDHKKPYRFMEPPEKRPRVNAESSAAQTQHHLKLSFKLESSCYATICLREMMKS